MSEEQTLLENTQERRHFTIPFDLIIFDKTFEIYKLIISTQENIQLLEKKLLDVEEEDDAVRIHQSLVNYRNMLLKLLNEAEIRRDSFIKFFKKILFITSQTIVSDKNFSPQDIRVVYKVFELLELKAVELSESEFGVYKTE